MKTRMIGSPWRTEGWRCFLPLSNLKAVDKSVPQTVPRGSLPARDRGARTLLGPAKTILSPWRFWRQEFGTLLSSLGQNPTEQELQEWIGGDGEHDASRIDFHTFLSLMSRKLKETDPWPPVVYPHIYPNFGGRLWHQLGTSQPGKLFPFPTEGGIPDLSGVLQLCVNQGHWGGANWSFQGQAEENAWFQWLA